MKTPHHRARLSRNGAGVWLALALLLVVPGYAVSRWATVIDWRVLVVVPLALSTFAFFVYRGDKCRAETGRWRIPESTLHLLALIGGWPGAFLAQRWFRHKTAKTGFQLVFWLVVLSHQFLAADSLWDWRLSKEAWHLISSQAP